MADRTTDQDEARMKRTRRQVLAGAAGALGVLAAETLAKATPARAANGDPLLMGSANFASVTTLVDKTASDGFPGVQVNTLGSDAAVGGASDSGDGLYGETGGGGSAGVHGNNTGGGYGVQGQTDGGGAAGVWGDNPSGTGVQGTSGFIGVFGRVTGTGGIGVWGETLNDGSTGVLADASGTDGIALKVQGPASFSLSGMAVIAAGAKSVTVSGVSLRTTSLVLATAQNNVGVWVATATPNAAKSKLLITLNAPAPSGGVRVAWFVVN